MSDNKTLLKNLISSRKNIKRKILSIKRGVLDYEHSVNETLKPIIDPLNTITEKINDGENLVDNKNDYNLKTSLNQFTHFFEIPPENRIYDKTYGLYFEKETHQLKIGEYPVEFINDNTIVVGDIKYRWTYGLWSILCEKIPKGVTQSDNETYLEILTQTRVYLNKNGKPKTNSGFKWKYIIKPLYERIKQYEIGFSKKRKLHIEGPSSAEPILQTNPFDFSPKTINKKGSGIFKSVIPNTQLVYYDDPNELVTRLNLLVSSQYAGNTGVNNEIISIIEELCERNLIHYDSNGKYCK